MTKCHPDGVVDEFRLFPAGINSAAVHQASTTLMNVVFLMYTLSRTSLVQVLVCQWSIYYWPDKLDSSTCQTVQTLTDRENEVCQLRTQIRLKNNCEICINGGYLHYLSLKVRYIYIYIVLLFWGLGVGKSYHGSALIRVTS